MKIFIAILLITVFTSCGSVSMPDFDSLTSRQPKIISVTPEDGAVVAPDESIIVNFSMPIDPETVDTKSLAVVKIGEDANEDDLIDDAEDDDLTGIKGAYEFDVEGTSVSFRANSPFDSGTNYIIIATDDIMTEDLLPLNQHPGRGFSPFVSMFTITVDGTFSGSSSGEGGSGGADVDADADADADAGGGGGEIVRNRPADLVINEVLYDVQGRDTDGDVFIELYGDPGGDITGYKIYLVNGDDGVIKDTIELPSGAVIADDGIYLIADKRTGSEATRIAGADFVDNFDPQNGPDCIQLVDHNGALLDAIGYGEPIVGMAENGLACFEGTSTAKVSSGQSLSRVEGADSEDNSVDFVALDIPTPGEK